MPSTLSVHQERRSRSKSPSGRERDRSHSRDTRAKSPPRKEQRRSSKYSESSSESSEDDRRHREKKSSKKYYEDDREDDRRKSKSSRKYKDEESEDSDRHRSSRSSKSHRRDPSVSEDDRRRSKSHREKKRSDESDSDRKSSRKKSSSKSKEESESSGSEDINISIHRKSKDKKESKSDRNGRAPEQQSPYAYPPGYSAGYPPPQGYQDTRHMSYVGGDPRYAPPGADIAPPPGPQRAGSFSGQQYANVDGYQYAQPDQKVAYKYNAPKGKEKQYIKTYNSKGEVHLMEVPEEHKGKEKQYIKTYNSKGEVQLVEVPQEHERKRTDDRKYHDDRRGSRSDKKYHNDKYSSSPEDTTRKLGALGLGAGLGAGLAAAGRRPSHDGGRPPASPLLEAYKGTYQSISPMPSALVLHKHKNDSDLSDFDLEEDSDSELDSDDPNFDIKKKIRKLEQEKKKHAKEREMERHGERPSTSRHNSSSLEYEVRKPRDRGGSDVSDMAISTASTRKRVMFYDAAEDAKKIAAALEGTHKPPNVRPLIHILPGLSDDDLMALRLEYKSVAKVGGQGINIAKHIKMRVPGNLGKVTYATALGRWESEAFWANSWYQGGATRRELLIESLMGRTNSDIREIKNCFKDKRYGDDLEKCMRAELKADKFRTAILLALEERRMPESSPLDSKQVKEDVIDLHRALSNAGGESAMISIIVVRSDKHLREVLRIFEKTYSVNFARAMIEKSRNLVGETLAHVLNGALNRAMRDALLVNQAIYETAPGKERAELLISRLVRLHWEPKMLEKVKEQFRARYKTSIESAIAREVVAHMKTEEGRQWSEFCIELVRSSS